MQIFRKAWDFMNAPIPGPFVFCIYDIEKGLVLYQPKSEIALPPAKY